MTCPCPAGGFKPQFFPQLDGIMQLFQRPATAASLLLHIYAINLFLGRTICLEGGWVRACRAGSSSIDNNIHLFWGHSLPSLADA